LRFNPDQIPQVNGMWAVTLYALPSKQFFPNPIGRYSINSSMLGTLTRDPDGGLTIFIQNDSPEDVANWIPAPKGPFVVSLRIYGPRPGVFEGGWQKPSLRKL
jgi:hypothetical protein